VSEAYAKAGVDVEAGEKAVALMKASVLAASRPEVVGDFGGFAGLFDATALTKFRRPLLATGTDGVGTKVVVAQKLGIHHTIGIDLVAMIADDIVVCGAEPLFLTDYIATGKVDPQVVADIVRGVAEGCNQAGMALLGGETAEHPGLMQPGEYDIAGAGTGVVEADELLSADRVQVGDVVISMRASGLHSNGYSLARFVLLGEAGKSAGLSLEKHVEELGRTLGEEMLEPTRIYALDCLALAKSLGTKLHTFSHITGGGIAANIARVLPVDMAVDVETVWEVLPVFSLIKDVGTVSEADMAKTFNMGVGMVAIVDAAAASQTIEFLKTRNLDPHIVGEVRTRKAGENGDSPAKGGKGGAVFLR
jgi:phosphoribosylformylglycinamidine cyclo-ligase